MTNKTWDKWMNFWIKSASVFTIVIIVGLIGFVFVNGIGHINGAFFVNDYDEKIAYGQFQLEEGDKGITVEKTSNGYKVLSIDRSSSLYQGQDRIGQTVKITKGDTILTVDKDSYEGLESHEFEQVLAGMSGETEIKVKFAGHGIWPMLVSTLMIIGLTLLVAVPIGVFAAIYLNEYAKQGRLVNIIRFSIECLAGIPSIIYGLFGMLFFVGYLNFNFSILAGVFTVAIILLPIIIRTTEEALKTVPVGYREGSLALGATNLETITKLVVPNSLPGILTAIVLSVGRIIGESAALILTAGTVARIPGNVFESASTLTVKAYTVAKEEGNIEMACAIGIVIIVIVLILNFFTRAIDKFSSSRGGK